jgi:EAL and modified HD-GYP domain-containing signal transduction protein
MITAMVRAKMCELIATFLKMEDADTCFTAGLFSVLDALLDLPLDKILETLPLSDELNDALLKREGPFGKVLNGAIAYEKGDWDTIGKLKLPKQKVLNAYPAAVDWATSVGSELDK